MTMDDNYLHSKVSSSEDTLYVEVFTGNHMLCSDQDASDLVVLCMENKVDRILIHDGVFADSFFSFFQEEEPAREWITSGSVIPL